MLPKVKSHQIQRKGDHLRDRPEFKMLLYVSCSYTFKKILLEYSYFHDIRKHLTLKFFQKCRMYILILVWTPPYHWLVSFNKQKFHIV